MVRAGDIVVAKTDPPLISVCVSAVCQLRRAVLINWLQDIFPEVASALQVKGLTRGPIYNLLKVVRNWSLKKASANVVLGEFMAEKIDSEISQPEKTKIIPNWVVGENMKPIDRGDNFLLQEWKLSDKFIVGYSGNLGRAHDYKTVFNAAARLVDDERVVFLIIGGGAGYELLQEMVKETGLSNVLFKPYQPSARLNFSLSVPDVHIVSLEPGLEGFIVPSKFYGILSVGKPVIFLGDADGELARIVKREALGKSIPVGQPGLLIDAINTVRLPINISKFGHNARLLYERSYSSQASRKLWREVLREIQ